MPNLELDLRRAIDDGDHLAAIRIVEEWERSRDSRWWGARDRAVLHRALARAMARQDSRLVEALIDRGAAYRLDNAPLYKAIASDPNLLRRQYDWVHRTLHPWMWEMERCILELDDLGAERAWKSRWRWWRSRVAPLREVLQWAAEGDRAHVVEHMARKWRIDMREVRFKGWSAIELASLYGSVDVLASLVALGIGFKDPTRNPGKGRRERKWRVSRDLVVLAALQAKSARTVAFLLDHGASLGGIENLDGAKWMHIPVDVLKLLHERGCRVHEYALEKIGGMD